MVVWLIVSALVAGFFLGAWVLMAQPSRTHARPSAIPPPVENLRIHVTKLAGEFSPRDFTHEANLNRCTDYIRSAWTASGGRVTNQTFRVGSRTYLNVRVFFGPATGERVVVGAHYDTEGTTPGADDNASGVAGLIELGRLLGQNRPTKPVELVAYCLEEPPFFRTEHMGSAHHARLLKAEGVEVRAMISLEMIGYYREDPRTQHYPIPLLRLFYPDRGDYVAVVGRIGDRRLTREFRDAMRGTTPLPVHSINAPAIIPGIDLSDHLNYWQAGYPALMVTDTSFYRNNRYHQPEDTPDTLDYPRMAQAVVAVYEAVQRLAR
jgi:hypothetical protein